MLYEVMVDGSQLSSLMDRLSDVTGVAMPAEMRRKFRKDVLWARAPLISAHDAYGGCQYARDAADAGEGVLSEAADGFIARLARVIRDYVTFFMAACWEAGATVYMGVSGEQFGIFISGEEEECQKNLIKLI
jgi:hypothetical protein